MPATLDRPVPAHHRRPDVDSQRQTMQDEIRRLPELREELRQAAAEKAEIQERVDAGELTPRAMTDVRLRWEHLGRRISNATSTFRNQLVGSAPESLRDEFYACIERKRKCIERHHRAKELVPRLAGELNVEARRYAEIVERQSKPDAQRWPEHEHRDCQRRLAAMERELAAAQDDLDDAQRQLDEALQCVADAKQRCIDA